MKILKRTTLILLILIILLYSIIPPKCTYAEESGDYLSSSQEAGQIIADFASDMVNRYASETIYDFGENWTTIGMPQNYGRAQAYKGYKVTGYAQSS